MRSICAELNKSAASYIVSNDITVLQLFAVVVAREIERRIHQISINSMFVARKLCRERGLKTPVYIYHQITSLYMEILNSMLSVG